jgi:hypothetical protein
VARAREDLRGCGAEGASLNARITRALTGRGGALLRTAERAHVHAREYARRAGAYLVQLVIEGMENPMALSRGASYALHQALADQLMDLAFATDPRAGTTASLSRTLKDGSRLTNGLPSHGEILKLAHAATTQARLELLTALDLEQRAPGAGRGTSPDLAAKFEQILAAEKAAAERGRALLAQRAANIDVHGAKVVSANAEPAKAVVVAPAAAPVRTPTAQPAPAVVVAPATPPPDPFADLRRVYPNDERAFIVEATARVVRWRSDAVVAKDQGKTYRGPRTVPGYVARWLRQSGRGAELEIMTALGFFIEQQEGGVHG